MVYHPSTQSLPSHNLQLIAAGLLRRRCKFSHLQKASLVSQFKDYYVPNAYQMPQKEDTVWALNAPWNVTVSAPVESKRIALDPKACL